ncbi:chorismate mutase, partial [Buchnera aphidicola (Hormaphis cornu)]
MIPLKINLLKLRNKINIIDKKIVILLSKRKSLYQDIVQEKLIQKKPIRDIHRENELIKQLKNLGKKYNLNTHYIKKIFQIIIEDSVSTQQKLLQYFYEKKNNNFQKISYLGPRESYSYIAACLYTSTLSKNLIKYAENNFK